MLLFGWHNHESERWLPLSTTRVITFKFPLQPHRTRAPEMLPHTVWRTWLFIAHSDEIWLYYQLSLPHLYFSLQKVGSWQNLGVKGWILFWQPGVRDALFMCPSWYNRCQRTLKGELSHQGVLAPDLTAVNFPEPSPRSYAGAACCYSRPCNQTIKKETGTNI